MSGGGDRDMPPPEALIAGEATTRNMSRPSHPTRALGDEALLTLAQWLSPAFPTGAFAWSHGLELAAIPDVAGFDAWLADVLDHGAGRNDTILLAAAWRHPDAAVRIDAMARAFAPSAERLMEADEQGAAFARTVGAIWGVDVPPVVLPVAIGIAARAVGLPLDATARMALHAFASNLTAVATRAIPLGQTEAQTVLARHASTVNAVVDAALPMGLDDLGGTAFLVDIASMNHETRRTRIYRS